MSYEEYTVKVYDNRTEWFNTEGEFHRLDGPAVEWDGGSKHWIFNGKLHRIDGPAAEYSDGTKAWYLNGECMTEEEHAKRTRVSECAGKQIVIDGVKYTLTPVVE